MQTYRLEIDGQTLEVVRDSDGKFIIPNHLRPMNTALKPAFEPIVLARKPLSEGTVAANVLRWGTGALNIDGCRVPTDSPRPARAPTGRTGNVFGAGLEGLRAIDDTTEGRWPANVVHDGSDEVVGAFPSNSHRFFYSAKASKADRAGSKHPTVKPVALIEWLATLITPPGGVILDPFAGSGTAGVAARNRGFKALLIEREAEYVADICGRFSNNPPPATNAAEGESTAFSQTNAVSKAAA